MEQFTEEQQTQIWNRVAGQSEQDCGCDDLEAALRMAAENYATFRGLARTAAGPEKLRLTELAAGSRETAAVLRGMLRMGGAAVPDQLSADARGHRARMLSHCLRRSRQMYISFAGRMAEPEYGPVFHVLAEREQACMASVLALMGKAG